MTSVTNQTEDLDKRIINFKHPDNEKDNYNN